VAREGVAILVEELCIEMDRQMWLEVVSSNTLPCSRPYGELSGLVEI